MREYHPPKGFDLNILGQPQDGASRLSSRLMSERSKGIGLMKRSFDSGGSTSKVRALSLSSLSESREPETRDKFLTFKQREL
ncbi:hypothetical protein WN55_00670 [Dufourea novaeangliae]|uniref:Uncharacterized protein n=1 Tax=Dufourea novaeangliae TaxID=178035 RepID=A0A154NY44_DUFNO|nr:hypothetical protein WN55_00670 [Dufourea novaeangliae]